MTPGYFGSGYEVLWWMGLGQCVSPDIYWAGQCGEWLVVGVGVSRGTLPGFGVRLSVGWRGGGESCGGWAGTLRWFWLATTVGSGGRQTCNLAVQVYKN